MLSRVFSYLLLAALILRIAVPVGYMPNDTSEGWYLAICPDGLTAGKMSVLAAGSGHHHHDNSDQLMPLDCELGGGFTTDFDLPLYSEIAAIRSQAIVQTNNNAVTVAKRITWRRLARAPPLTRST